MDEVVEKIDKANLGRIEKNVLMSKYTTYKLGGEVSAIVYPKDVDSLVKLVKLLKATNTLYKVVGNGSNLLFSDNKYEGIIIKLNDLDDIEFLPNNKIRVEAGYSLMKLSLATARRGLTGLEFASGIPGTVGGSVFMNAGAYKSDMGYVVQEVKVLTPDFRIITLENKEMNFHYRSSFLQTHRDYICLSVIIKLEVGDKSAIEDVIRERRSRRVASQPLEYPSAGSVFRNPDGMYAGQMIEELGLKGMIKGGAMISDKHANFIVNFKNAKAADVKYLIDLVHTEVLKKYKVDMKIEQEFVNWE